MPNLENGVLMCTPNHPHTDGVRRGDKLNHPIIMGTPGKFANFVKSKVRRCTLYVYLRKWFIRYTLYAMFGSAWG